MNGATFNLIEERWITVTLLDGSTQEVSIREALHQASTISRISGELPTQDFAVLRLLVTILWRAYTRNAELPDSDDSFSDAGEWWAKQLSTASLHLKSIDAYLDDVTDRFWLFHPAHPFYQVHDLETSKGDTLPVSRIIADAESDYFSSRAGEGRETLTYAEAARWLLHIHAYDYSGIKPAALGDLRAKGGKGYPIGTGAAGAGGGVVLHGSHLAETLILNLPAQGLDDTIDAQSRGETTDLPAWERQPTTAAARHDIGIIPDGPLDALTWQSRRVRLYGQEGEVTEVVLTNGDKLELQNNHTDPFFARQFSKNLSKQGSSVYLPKKHYSERTFWRGVESLMYRHAALPEHTRSQTPDAIPAVIHNLLEQHDWPMNNTVNIELIGLEYGPQDSVITHVVHNEIPIHLRLLTAHGNELAAVIVQNVSRTLSAASAVGSFSGMLTLASGGDYSHDTTATAKVLAELESAFRDWLLSLSLAAEPATAVAQWVGQARRIILRHANDLAEAAGPPAMRGKITMSNTPGKEPKPAFNSTGSARIWLLKELAKHLPNTTTIESGAS